MRAWKLLQLFSR